MAWQDVTICQSWTRPNQNTSVPENFFTFHNYLITCSRDFQVRLRMGAPGFADVCVCATIYGRCFCVCRLNVNQTNHPSNSNLKQLWIPKDHRREFLMLNIIHWINQKLIIDFIFVNRVCKRHPNVRWITWPFVCWMKVFTMIRVTAYVFVFYLVVSDSLFPSAGGGSVEEWLFSITLLAPPHSSFSFPLAPPPGCCLRPPMPFCCQPLKRILKNKEKRKQIVIRQKSTCMNYQRLPR